MPYKLFNYLLLLLAILSTACSPDTDVKDTQKNLPQTRQNKPDNGVREVNIDGQKYHYIPIEDKTFLIPDKSWLKGYSRNATDNQVSYISLHAMAPNLTPWSPEIHNVMYGTKINTNNLVEITLNNRDKGNSNNYIKSGLLFNQQLTILPYGLYGHRASVSDIESEYNSIHLEAFVINHFLYENTTFYRYIHNNKIKYLIECNNKGLSKICILLTPYSDRVTVEIKFSGKHLLYSVDMAENLLKKLDNFEQAAQQYKSQ